MKKTTEKRIEEINKYLIINQKATTNELSKLMGVSPEMIRRDLAYLEEKGSIIRVHGGAMARGNISNVPFSARKYENKNAKESLCRRAIDYIKNDDVVFIDPSTTALQLGRLIVLKKNITLVTNCLELVNIASKSEHKIILLGGEYSKSGDRTVGFFPVNTVKKMMFDVAFLGSDGCKGTDGPGTISENEVFLNEEVLSRSRKKVLMIDSSKFERNSNFVYAKFEDFDVLITDKLSDEIRGKINIPIIEEVEK